MAGSPTVDNPGLVGAPHRSARDPLMDRAERAAALLRAMAHPQRLRVLCLLVEGEQSVGAMNAEIPLSQSALSQHLARLRRLALVETRKEAQTVYYRLVPGVVRDLISVLRASS